MAKRRGAHTISDALDMLRKRAGGELAKKRVSVALLEFKNDRITETDFRRACEDADLEGAYTDLLVRETMARRKERRSDELGMYYKNRLRAIWEDMTRDGVMAFSTMEALMGDAGFPIEEVDAAVEWARWDWTRTLMQEQIKETYNLFAGEVIDADEFISEMRRLGVRPEITRGYLIRGLLRRKVKPAEIRKMLRGVSS